jgi:ribosome maturation factor RimP
MDLAGRIADLIRPTVAALNHSIVQVKIFGRNHMRLQVMIERCDGRSMMVDDCALVSRAISAVLDVEDPIQAAYTLEVSSPGIDRPLVCLGDFQRFAGLEALVELVRLIEGRRKLRGRILGVTEDRVHINVDGIDWSINIADILRAKLVLTEDLLAQAHPHPAEG